MDRGDQCLKPVVGSFPVLYDCWKMCVMMGAICSAVSSWASSFILVEIFQLFNYSVCANIKRGHAVEERRRHHGCNHQCRQPGHC